jgi:hypothetical protein
MKTKDLFQLAVRLLGLVFLYLAIRHLAPIFHVRGEEMCLIILTAGIYFGAAWWLIGTQCLIQRAYPDETREPHQAQPGVRDHKVNA